MAGIILKKEISKEEQNTLIKIFVYQQKLDKKIVDFKNAKETNEKILNLQSIKKELFSSIEKLVAKKVGGVSEARVRADLIVIRDFLTNLNEKEENAEYQNLIKKISGVFQSGEEDELFAIHTYVDEVLKNNKSQNKDIIQLISKVNDDYLDALHTLKNEGSDTPVDTPSITDLKSHIAALNEIINKVGSSKIQGVDIVALKDQLNEAVKKLELAKTQPLEINPEKAIEEEQTDLANHEDNEHYGKILNKFMGEPQRSAFDEEDLSQIDVNEGPKGAVHQIPNSFNRAVKDMSVAGSGDLINGLDDYLNFVDKTYELNDVQKILAKKRKDRIMGNIPNLCGKEILMWVKQELQTMFLDFQKAGMHPLKRIEAVKDLGYGLVDAVFNDFNLG